MLVVQRRLILGLECVLRFARVFGQRPNTRDIAPILGVVILRQGQFLAATRGAHRRDCHDSHARQGDERPCPRAYAGSHAALPAAVPHRQTQNTVGLANLAQNGNRYALTQGHQVAVLEIQAIRIRGRHRQRVAPGGLGHRIRKLLQPTVVGIAAVVEPRIHVEYQFEIACSGLGRARGGLGARFAAEAARRKGGHPRW